MNIVVTGASSGIGYELVKFFSLDEKNTIYAVSRNADKLNKLIKACNTARVKAIVIDITESQGIAKLISEIKNSSDSIDILVNNAGSLVNKPFEQITEQELEYIYKVNVFAPFMLMQNLLSFFGKKNKTHIVNISSMGGFQGSAKFAGLSAYSSSKAAIAGLTECLAEEFKEKNIAVNCLALGSVQTEMLEKAFSGYKAPLQPAEMAEFIGDFALNGHRYFNGKILPVSLTTP